MDLKFKYFLLNEGTEYLATRVGDILNALQDIQQHSEGMGTRQLVSNAERIVNQIRRILHTSWNSDSLDILEMLQRAAVAIKKGIEEKNDLVEVLGNAANELQDSLAKLGLPINKVGGEENEKEEKPDQTSPPQDGEKEPEIQPNQATQGAGLTSPETPGAESGPGTGAGMDMSAAPPSPMQG